MQLITSPLSPPINPRSRFISCFTSGSLERFPHSIIYTLSSSLHSLNTAITDASGVGCRLLSPPSDWADLCVLPLPAASVTLMCDETVGSRQVILSPKLKSRNAAALAQRTDMPSKREREKKSPPPPDYRDIPYQLLPHTVPACAALGRPGCR